MNRETCILFTRYGMGDAPTELQQKLAGVFLTLIGKDTAPGLLAFYGEGVKLACEGSPVLEPLRALADKGATLVICQTCLEFFGLREKVRIGVVGGMGDIVAAMSTASKVISV
ncbi:MAG: DsrE family protein [Chloroflexi bacterium]|nr:DsrE family protein [Chloroflexota bacterium]